MKRMIAEVIAIGDELTSGQRLDTNSQWISQQLGDLGLRVLYHSTVADELEACGDLFRAAIERADVVVATGGLGPTADDLTRDAIALATGTQLELDELVLKSIRRRFARRGRTMPERNRMQAMFPRGSQPIANPHGTAPGISMRIERAGKGPCQLIALPGVPAELFEMWEQTVAAQIAAQNGSPGVIRHRRIKCFGTGESHLEQMLPDLIRRGRQPSVGITVHEATITLRITAQGPDEAACFQAMEPTIETVREHLGPLVFGEEDDELEHAIARLLTERQQTIATVEWGTQGLIARWLRSVPALALRNRGGLVVPTQDALAGLVGVLPDFIERHGTTSSAVAEAMAENLRERLAADIALAVSDVPPAPQQDEKPGQYHVAVATASGVSARSFRYAAHPAILEPLAAKTALNHLRLMLLEDEEGSKPSVR